VRCNSLSNKFFIYFFEKRGNWPLQYNQFSRNPSPPERLV